MATLIGQSLGRYKILEQLGEGGMATVYKAYDTRLDRNVAIKVIRTDQFAPVILDEILKRFEREAKALAKLSHPNIVGVHDYGEYNGAPFLVMEYIPSGNLKHRSEEPMPWKDALRIVIPVALALAYAHEHNIIHRDIKPANILLTENGMPMVSDFGIAKILEGSDGATLTGTGMSIGTPEYMAPEQWTGETVPQSDIYSLAVVLYELVTGRKPYTADTPIAVMLKQVNDPLPRPRQFTPDLPEGLEDVLLMALEKRPEDRYKSMNDFAAALENLDNSKTVATAGKKDESQVGGKTLLASGAEMEAQPVMEPKAEPAPATPIPTGGSKKTSTVKWGRWVPFILAAILLCGGVTVGASLLVKGLAGRIPLAGLVPITGTTQSVSTQPTSITQNGSQVLQPNSTPHAEIKVLWDTSHHPRTSEDGTAYTPDGMYKSLAQALSSENFVINSGDLSNLNSYDILVLSEATTSTSYTDNEATAIEQYVRVNGHGLLILSDTPTLENLADIISRRFSISLGELTSDSPANMSNEPFFTGVSSIQFLNGGGVFQVSSPSQTASVDISENSVIAFCGCDAGRVMAIADTNLWDNQGLNRGDNQRFAINVFEWLAKLSP
jgi:serine/threonine protein kinase